MKLPLDVLLKELENIAGDLRQKREDFPNDCCTEAAIEIYKKLGFSIESGSLRGEPHTWNSCNGYYVDITGAQFGLPDIFVVGRKEAVELHGYAPDPAQGKAVIAFMKACEKAEDIEDLTSLSFARPF